MIESKFISSPEIKASARACLKTPTPRRVWARGLEETAEKATRCRPGALTGRAFKPAPREKAFTLVVMLATAAFLPRAEAQPVARTPEPVWLLREKMRALSYVTPAYADADLRRTQDLGFNTALFINTGDEMEPLLPIFEAAQKYQVHVFWVDYLKNKFRQEPPPKALATDALRFVGAGGERFPDDPCPLDAQYWEALAGSRAVALAQLARDKYSYIGGLLIDLEDYNGAGLWDQYCFCAACFERFVGEKRPGLKRDLPVSAEKRRDWLQTHKLLSDYESFAHQRLQGLLRGIRERVDKFAPHFLFAAYPWPGMKYSRDMVLGLGREAAPFVFLSELTYGGYRPLFDEEFGKFLEEKLPAVVVPGLAAHADEQLNPYTMAANAYYCSVRAQGYWIYVGSYPLLDAPAGRAVGSPFLGSPAEWAAELKKVNERLRNLSSGPLAEPAVEFPYPLLEIQDRLGLRFVNETEVKELSAQAKVVSQRWKDQGLPWQGSELVLQADQPAAHFTVSETVTRKDRYAVFADITRGPNRGSVQLFVDGRKVGSAFDAFLPILTPGQPVALGECVLHPGEHQFQFQGTAKAASSQGYWIGLRGMKLVARGLSPFPEAWNVIGPFDNTDDKGFYTVYPPEQKINFAGRHRGKNGLWLEWKTVQADPTGYLPLRPLYPEKNYVVAYAQVFVYSPRDTAAKILLGTDDGGKLWVNGDLVWAMNTHRSATPDENRLYVQLKKGWNAILAKVTQAQWDWGLYLRVEDPDGTFRYALRPE